MTSVMNLLLLSDSALPTGGFSHSYGLETYIAHHGGNPGLQDWLDSYLREEWGKIDGPIFAMAHRSAAQKSLARVKQLDEVANAMRIPREWREAGAQTGKRLLIIVETLLQTIQLQDATLFLEYKKAVQDRESPGQYGVVAGLVHYLLGIPLQEAITAYALATMRNLIGAAIRLVPLGQTEGLRLQCEFNTRIQDVVQKALIIDDLEQIGGFSPWLEMDGIRHERLYTRLFIS